MQFKSILIDSLRESLDRRIFWALLVVSGVILLAMAGIGFEKDRVTFLFGLAESSTGRYNPLSVLGQSRIVGLVVYVVLSALVGWLGLVLMIIATAGFFPSFMERGAIDVVLSKPLSRTRLFLYKYLGGLVFVTIQAGVFVVLSFLVMGVRWGVWVPGYLLSIPLLVLLFSYVYCVSVLVAVRTRSTVAAILISLGAWSVFALVHQAPAVFDQIPDLKKHTRLYQMVRVASWIPPKTGDVTYLAARWSGAGTSIDAMPSAFTAPATEADRKAMVDTEATEEAWMRKNPWTSIGSSLLFEAVVLAAAMWTFVRRDF